MLDAFKTNGSSPPADVFVQYQPGDTLGLVVPVTDTADAWIDAHVLDPQRIGRVLVVEHRYIGDLLAGMSADGLALAAL